MKTTLALFLFAFFLVCSAGAAQAAWIVELTSGRTLEANSCRVEKGRVYLQYPVGEASILLSQVRTIRQDDRGVALFQQKAVAEAREASSGATGPPQTVKPQAPGTRLEKAGAPAPPPAENPMPASESPAKSPPAAYGQFELKPKFTPESLSQLRSESVEVKTSPKDMVYDPEVEDIINSLQNADEAQRTEIEKRMNKLFETDNPNNIQQLQEDK